MQLLDNYLQRVKILTHVNTSPEGTSLFITVADLALRLTLS